MNLISFRISFLFLTAMAMALGNHLVAGDIEHGTSRKTQHEGKEGSGETAQSKTHPYAYHLQQTNGQRDGEGAHQTDTGHEQRCNDDHPLGNVLHGQTKAHCPRWIGIAHAHTGSHALGQLMDGNGHDEKQDAAELRVGMMLLGVQARDVMEMGSDEIEDVEEERTRHDTHSHQPPGSIHLKGWRYEPQRGCRQHDAGTVAQHGVVPLVGQLLDEIAQHTTDNGRKTEASST